MTALELDVQRLEARRYSLMLAGDVAALSEVLAPELLYVHSSGQIDGKDEYLSPLRSGKLRYLTLHHHEERIIVTGSTAVVLGEMQADVIVDGVERRVDNRHLAVWAREPGGGWKFAAYHPAPVPQR